MNIYDFEDEFNPTILGRGRDYFFDGEVAALKESSPGIYEARVTGSELYTVDLELAADGSIIDIACDCPYDWGPYCKHEAAVLYELRDRLQGGVVKSEHPLPEIDLSTILQQQDRATLLSLLEAVIDGFGEVEDYLRIRFSDTAETQETTIRSELSSYLSRLDFAYDSFTHKSMVEVLAGPRLILKAGEDAQADDKPLEAVRIALVLVTELIGYKNLYGDGYGEFSKLIGEGIDMLNSALCDIPDPMSRTTIFYNLLEAVKRPLFDQARENQTEFLQLLLDLAHEEGTQQSLSSYLDELIASLREVPSWEQNPKEAMILIAYRLRLKGDREQAKTYLLRNLQYPSLRDRAIEVAFTGKEYQRVIELTLEGLAVDCSYTIPWLELQYQAATEISLIPFQRSSALQLACRGDISWYERLKSLYSAEEWVGEYVRVLDTIKRMSYSTIYPDILEKEGESELLLEYLAGRYDQIGIYEKKLLIAHAQGLYTVYEGHIFGEAERANHRGAYFRVAQMVAQMKQIASKEVIAKLMNSLRTTYSRRPAFMDELSKI